MSRYRKKPVEIEAVRVLNNEYADNPLTFEETPDWLQKAFDEGTIKPVFRGEDYWYYDIETPEGTMTAGPDDFLIRGTRGEIYPCKPGPFKDTFEEVSDVER